MSYAQYYITVAHLRVKGLEVLERELSGEKKLPGGYLQDETRRYVGAMWAAWLTYLSRVLE